MVLRQWSMTTLPPAGRIPRGFTACAQLVVRHFIGHRQSLARTVETDQYRRLYPVPVGASPGSVILAADTIAVAVESVDVRSDHLNGSLDVRGAIAAAAGAVDVASDRHTGTAVVRVALLGFLCSDRDDLGDRRPGDYLLYQLFMRLNPVAECHLIGEDLYPPSAGVSHPGSALRKRGIIHSHRLERDSPPAGNDSLLDYWRGLRRVLGTTEGGADTVLGTSAVRVAVGVGAPPDPQALISSGLLTANVILMAGLIPSSIRQRHFTNRDLRSVRPLAASRKQR